MTDVTGLACISSNAGQCGRPNFADALQHARDRAAALRTRQTVTVQRYDRSAYYVIRSVRSA